jgi:hypothetical protein
MRVRLFAVMATRSAARTSAVARATPDAATEPQGTKSVAIDAGLGLIAAALVGMAWLRVFRPDLRDSLDDSTLKYLLVAAVVLVAPRIRTLSLGDLKVELAEAKAQARRADAKAEQAVQEASVALRALEATAPGGRGPAGPRIAAAAARSARALASVPEETGETDADDPNKGRFGRSPVGAGRRLSAAVTPLAGTDELFEVALQVEAGADAQPLGTSVTFHLHPTFRRTVVEVPVEGRTARLTLVAWGAFTVGVVLLDGTRLELDLSGPEVQAPAKFKLR